MLNFIKNIFKRKMFPNEILFVTIKQCDRDEYFIRDFGSIEYEFDIVSNYKDYYKYIKQYEYKNKIRLEKFIYDDINDYIDIDFFPATFGTGRHWFLAFKMKKNIKTHSWQYKRIYEDIITTSRFRTYRRAQAYEKLDICVFSEYKYK